MENSLKIPTINPLRSWSVWLWEILLMNTLDQNSVDTGFAKSSLQCFHGLAPTEPNPNSTDKRFNCCALVQWSDGTPLTRSLVSKIDSAEDFQREHQHKETVLSGRLTTYPHSPSFLKGNTYGCYLSTVCQQTFIDWAMVVVCDCVSIYSCPC